ncbi:MAG: response regulator transcription factor [Clostridiales bacterium]|nr:response regulator transcription factor [Clostridiales bacterium]MBR5357915.1 response regulator transcription factor [Clostridiales bacterium]
MTDILIVEDNKEISELLGDFLKKEGFTVSVASTGEEALTKFGKYGAKIVLLDIMLPGMDGYAVCSEIRTNSNVPIFILSAKTDKNDKLNGIILGADDYIEKPYDIDLLIAKIKGLFARRYSSDELTLGNITINKVDYKVYKDGKEIEMTIKEYELMLLLAENAGKVLTKEFLFNRIWGFDSDSEQQTLTVHITRLRQKIEEDPKNPKRILTVWGKGYKFE